ncbi:MAG: NAD(P)-binding domain-containing protein [Gordonia sp. (in: high G+C Gram-positive bacteria)]|uniref:NAD(P)-binding domain-containing protein n=1 Tax=Gordonia sp. (in: high G+C Gram-positive bacteria) TaxID=84139 RepID=UPI003BB5240D
MTATTAGPQPVDVVVIGAGQAGLSAAYHLAHRGVVPVARATAADRTFVVLDGEDAAGGAWRHRWQSLRMATVNGIFELPGYPVPPADPEASSSVVLPAYFSAYEQRHRLDVHRPVRVHAVRRGGDEPIDGAAARLIVETDAGAWSARYVINATGTWTKPYWPMYPGQETFLGEQLHVQSYTSAEAFAGRRVVIVGSGVSATQLLDEISAVTDTFWVTRREPIWEDGLSREKVVAALADVEERTRQGYPGSSIVRVTGMVRSQWVERAAARGALVRHPMFTRIEPDGVRMPDGTLEPADVILWATGFRPAVSHLAPLGLRTPHGGFRVANSRSLDEPRLFLIGYGASQSTIGANRAGRDAAIAIMADIG